MGKVETCLLTLAGLFLATRAETVTGKTPTASPPTSLPGRAKNPEAWALGARCVDGEPLTGGLPSGIGNCIFTRRGVTSGTAASMEKNIAGGRRRGKGERRLEASREVPGAAGGEPVKSGCLVQKCKRKGERLGSRLTRLSQPGRGEERILLSREIGRRALRAV